MLLSGSEWSPHPQGSSLETRECRGRCLLWTSRELCCLSRKSCCFDYHGLKRIAWVGGDGQGIGQIMGSKVHVKKIPRSFDPRSEMALGRHLCSSNFWPLYMAKRPERDSCSYYTSLNLQLEKLRCSSTCRALALLGRVCFCFVLFVWHLSVAPLLQFGLQGQGLRLFSQESLLL